MVNSYWSVLATQWHRTLAAPVTQHFWVRKVVGPLKHGTLSILLLATSHVQPVGVLFGLGELQHQQLVAVTCQGALGISVHKVERSSHLVQEIVALFVGTKTGDDAFLVGTMMQLGRTVASVYFFYHHTVVGVDWTAGRIRGPGFGGFLTHLVHVHVLGLERTF